MITFRVPTRTFQNVGIKAVDDYTLQYTLSQPELLLEFKIDLLCYPAC